ncbi:hypothetical protein AB835_14285 [Candidatus Endobugula sertula]|uniref:Uncharacterized protein n=1 Tax=Candidatus Endobugula sertula TaxID=62101 RepID=A0A1D2QLG0_9GAMM|nr:hypothetical protein AB835_14285 [Candidatus Endobugula sertula]
MLHQFCSNLQTMITRLIGQHNDLTASLEALEKHLESDVSWSSANRVELALIDFYDDITLLTEWQRRLAEINRLPKHLKEFYEEHTGEADSSKLRALLVRLVSDLQWFRESKRVVRFNES